MAGVATEEYTAEKINKRIFQVILLSKINQGRGRINVIIFNYKGNRKIKNLVKCFIFICSSTNTKKLWNQRLFKNWLTLGVGYQGCKRHFIP